MTKPVDNEQGVEAAKVPLLTLTFDPRTYHVTVSGSVPTLEFGKFMLQTALDAAEKQIAERDRGRIVTPATVEMFGR